jgi:hypothetical protein
MDENTPYKDLAKFLSRRDYTAYYDIPTKRNIMPRTTKFACDFEAFGPIDPRDRVCYDRIWGLRSKLTFYGVLAYYAINRCIKANRITEAGEYKLTITPGIPARLTLCKK